MFGTILYNSNSKNKTDDFGFVEAMISKISSDYSIDATRVYAMGFSNGADMFALACVLSDKIAAIVSMGGLLYKHTSENTNPSPKGIMSIHTNDITTMEYFIYPLRKCMNTG